MTEIANGQGIGRGSVVGTTLVAETVKDLEGKDLSDKVIVTNSIDETFVPYVEKALKLNYRRKWYYITKCNCWFRKGIPTVVGVEKAVKNISNNMLVTIDAAQGKNL